MTDTPLRQPIKNPESRLPETLANRLRENKVIPFVGAGVSMAVMRRDSVERIFPSWKELLRRAAERLKAEQKDPHANLVASLIEMGKPEDFLEAARRAFDGLGPNWYDFLREQFDHPRNDVADDSLDLARLVWQLGSQVILTTNYDKVLHWACPGRDDLAVWDIEAPAEQVALLRGELKRPVVWHLHGHIGNLANVILTPDGYNRLYLHEVRSDVPYKAALETLRQQLSSHSFLFVGFSFQDAHFSAQLRQLEQIFKDATGPHYVLLPRDEADQFARAGHPRIEVLRYDGHGPPLLEVLRVLTEAVGVPPATATGARPVVKLPASSLSVRIPPFHYGSVVPLDYFIDRENELERATEYIQTRQSFLIVGHRRAGKTSFGQKLIRAVMAGGKLEGMKILGSYLDLQQYSNLDVDRFLAHTLLNLIGEVARQVFKCKFTTLSRRNPFELHPELEQDVSFGELLALFHEVVERTHTRGRTTPSELRPDEFEGFIADLLEITHHKGWTDMFIFYDEANRLPLDLSVDFLTWNVGALNRAGIVSIYAASPEMAENFNPWSDREIRIGPFLSVEDMLRLLSKYYFGDASSQDELPVSKEAVVRIWELSQGVPYLIQHISGLSFSCASQEGSRRVEERHVRTAHEELVVRRPEIFHA